MMGRPVKKVVIAGGSTAGWCAAAALSRFLGPLLDITLAESEEIGIVGVGESTIPTVRTFHNFLGIYEREFLQATNATYKRGRAAWPATLAITASNTRRPRWAGSRAAKAAG